MADLPQISDEMVRGQMTKGGSVSELQPPEVLRLMARRVLAIVTPSFGRSRCSHCFTPWGNFGEDSYGHTVMYSETSGLMVVCDFCWPLNTVEERVEYARSWVLTIWKDDSDWTQIERAYRGASDEPVEACGSDIGVFRPRRRATFRGTRIDHGKWRRIAEELRARPGDWALLVEDGPVGSLAVRAAKINRGESPFGLGYEACIRGMDNRIGTLYARYVGTKARIDARRRALWARTEQED